MKKAALLSVSERAGLVEFARGLHEQGFALLASSGTGKALQEAGLPIVSVESYTGQKEILGGRVKTLHPKLYAGLLYRRGLASDEADIESENILSIDVVAVNLYPFSKLRAERQSDHAAMTELIDIGGPSMIRAAAKNHKFVLPVIDPADYPTVLEYLSAGKHDFEFHRKLAAKVLTTLAADAGDVASYLAEFEPSKDSLANKVSLQNKFFSRSIVASVVDQVQAQVLVKEQDLRYGENPHQKAGFYRELGAGAAVFKQLHGKELSYNNILDTEAIIRILSSLTHDRAAAVIVKHSNPCGVALKDSLLEALRAAKLSDPRSHFGGVLAFNRTVDVETAAAIKEDFAEIIVAPGFDSEALELLQTNKNLRLLEVSLPQVVAREIRVAVGGVLLQEADTDFQQDKSQPDSLLSQIEVASGGMPSREQLQDVELAWTLCAHVKSNAIVCVKNGQLLGVGAGQMSRIDSVELCLAKAQRHGHDLRGSVAASDAFFPFPDSVETLAKAGISIIIAPSGAKRDSDTVEAAKVANVTLLFTKARHFRH